MSDATEAESTSTTTRLQVFDATHLQAFARMRAQPDVGQFMAGGRFDNAQAKLFAQTVLAESARLRAASGVGAWAFCSGVPHRVLGFVGFDEPEAGGPLHLWYFADPAVWRQGHGTNAVRAALDEKTWRGAQQAVLALVHPKNLASRRLLLTCGFESAGFKRHAGTLCPVFRLEPVAHKPPAR